MTVDPAPYRQPDLYWSSFPADVQPPGDVAPCEWREVLVQIAAVDGPPEGQRAGIVYVWTYNPATNDPQQLFTAGVDDVPLHLPSPYAPRYASRLELKTDAGVLVVERSTGCGCRNPLKGMNPLAANGRG